MTLDDAVTYEVAGSWWARLVPFRWLERMAAQYYLRKSRRKYARYLRHMAWCAYVGEQERIAKCLKYLEDVASGAIPAPRAEAAADAPTVELVPLFSDIKFSTVHGFYYADRLHRVTRQQVDIVCLGFDIEGAEKWYEANIPPAQRVTP